MNVLMSVDNDLGTVHMGVDTAANRNVLAQGCTGVRWGIQRVRRCQLQGETLREWARDSDRSESSSYRFQTKDALPPAHQKPGATAHDV